VPPLAAMAARGFIAEAVYEQRGADIDLAKLDVVTVARDAHRKLSPVISPLNADLRTALAQGRKILQYHGYSDPNIPPEYSIEYFEAVRKFLKRDLGDFYRLFMIPGMTHCGGGPGATSFGGLLAPVLDLHELANDWQIALQHWVEDGVAPERMIATEFKLDRPPTPATFIAPGTPVLRTRPVCAYPRVASFGGTGNADDASSFRCVDPAAR
jgi:feruloyl esterase